MTRRNKQALELAMRDAMDGMEQLTSMLSYGRLPDDLEILSIGPDVETEAPPAPRAEVVPIHHYFKDPQSHQPAPARQEDGGRDEKYNKIIMLS